jgi:diguanylate cyclase (GGDEF)-like protein/PAS domain S-box-containing protein
MYKKYLFYLLIFALFMMVAIVALYQSELEDVEKTLRVESALLMDRQVDALNVELKEINADVRYLAGQQQLKELYTTGNKADLIKQLEQDYQLFSHSKKSFDQIRFIDKDGMEVIRVNFNDGSPSVVPPDKLQNKKHRYYFSEAIILDKGEVYTSPLDLNIENRQIELPLKPMIRFSTPVFDSDNNKIGIIVLNYQANRLLKAFKKNAQNYAGHAMLLNDEGFFLVAMNRELEWAFMFENQKEVTIDTQFPGLSQLINTQYKGQYRNQSGLFSFVHMQKGRKNKAEKAAMSCSSCDWTVVLFIPEEKIEAIAKPAMRAGLLQLLIIYIFMAAVLWLILFYRQKHRTDFEQHAKLNKALMDERDLFIGGPTVVFKYRNEFSWPIEWISQNIEQVLGYKVKQFTSGELNLANVIAPEYLKQVNDNIQRIKSEPGLVPDNEPFQMVHADGRRVWVQNSMSVVRDAEGRVTNLYGYINDITDRVEAEEIIINAQQLNQKVLDTINDPTLVIDVNNYGLVLVNNAAKQLYVKPGQENLNGLTCYGMSHKLDAPCRGENDPCPLQQVKNTGRKYSVIHKHFTANGDQLYVEVFATPIFGNQGELIQIIESHHDITERVKTETQLRKLATTDGLTKIFNRAKFDDELQMRFESSRDSKQSLALVMFDIDHFKQVNDRFGHDVGDSVLKELVSLMGNFIRKSDFLARWGGEEFMVLVSGADIRDIEKMANHLRSVIESHEFSIAGKVTASFGITLMVDSDSVASLLKRVDSALYQSKMNGRNRVTFIQG